MRENAFIFSGLDVIEEGLVALGIKVVGHEQLGALLGEEWICVWLWLDRWHVRDGDDSQVSYAMKFNCAYFEDECH